jgi:hypothetical protein
MEEVTTFRQNAAKIAGAYELEGGGESHHRRASVARASIEWDISEAERVAVGSAGVTLDCWMVKSGI